MKTTQLQFLESDELNFTQNTGSIGDIKSVPSTSKPDATSSNASISFDKISPATMEPIPKVKQTFKRTTRKRGKAAVFVNDFDYNKLVLANIKKK